MTTPTFTAPAAAAMTEAQREQFTRDGYLVVPGALTDAEVSHYTAAIDRVYDAARDDGRLAADGSMHLLSAVANCPEAAGLLDHGSTFPLVWSMLGWNVHVYHSHLDIHPPLPQPRPFRFEWHQDGGRQNRELETDPRPRMSVKLAFWLTDVSEPGRGNFSVVPGSHTWNRIDGPPRRDVEWPDPPGAIQVTANPGDAVFFDRRLWHSRSNNYSSYTRKAIFFGYTLRWIAIRDDLTGVHSSDWYRQLDTVKQQLLGGYGAGDGDHQWGHYPEDTPLYGRLAEQGLLNPDHPPLKP